jgi:hypothetical protein
MLGRFLSQLGSFVVLVLFTLGLPFLVVSAVIWGRNLTGAAADSIWLVKMGATFLGPFSAVLWYIAVCNLLFHRRAGYLMQAVVFFGTAAAIYLLLINRVYHL